MLCVHRRRRLTRLALTQVTYFKQKRLADWKKEQIIKEIEDKGGEVLPRPQGPAR